MSCDISNLRPEEAHRTYCWAAAASDRQSIFPSKCLEVSNRISIDRSNTKYRRLPIWHSTRMQPKIYHLILSWPFLYFVIFLLNLKRKQEIEKCKVTINGVIRVTFSRQYDYFTCIQDLKYFLSFKLLIASDKLVVKYSNMYLKQQF